MPDSSLRPVIMSAFGPPALACIRSWGRKGMQPGMISVTNQGEPDPASRYLSDYSVLPRRLLFTEEGLDLVASFLAGFNASGLICIEEKIALWLNDNKDKLPDSVALWLPANGMIRNTLDKIKQIEAARDVGLEVLPTHLFPEPDADVTVPEEHFPLCLRPSMPGSTTPFFKVKNVVSPTEVHDFLQTLALEAPVIGQPFKNLPNLVVHGCRTVTGESIGLQGFLVERKFQGVTLTIRPVLLKDDLRDRCIAFSDMLDLVGHYHFEFLYDPAVEKNYFLEFNHRFGGTTAKVMACGYDEPGYALQAFEVDAPVADGVTNCTVSNMKALAKSIVYAFSGKLTELDYPEESQIRRAWFTVKSLLYNKDEIFYWDDLPGTFAFYLGTNKI